MCGWLYLVGVGRVTAPELFSDDSYFIDSYNYG